MELAWFHKLGLTWKLILSSSYAYFARVDTSLNPLVAMLVQRTNTIYLHVVVALNFGSVALNFGSKRQCGRVV